VPQAAFRRVDVEGRLQERPTATDPVAVAGIDQLVRAAAEAAFGCALPRYQPVDQSAGVEVCWNGSGRSIEQAKASENAEGVGTVGFIVWCAAQAAFEGLTATDPGAETRCKGFEAYFAGGR